MAALEGVVVWCWDWDWDLSGGGCGARWVLWREMVYLGVIVLVIHRVIGGLGNKSAWVCVYSNWIIEVALRVIRVSLCACALHFLKFSF